MMQRRTILQALALAALMPGVSLAKAKSPTIEVYKSETCGCCTEWVKHLEANGFQVNARNVPNTAAYRQRYHVPPALGSCHTATVGGYALEGHVPAADIQRLLKEKPKAAGLTVPGMPMGSPGMEVEGQKAHAYDVLLFQKDGSHTVYRHVAAE